MGIDPITAAVVGGGASLLGGLFSSDSAEDAAQTQADSTYAATAAKIAADKEAAALVSKNALAAAKIQVKAADQAAAAEKAAIKNAYNLTKQGASKEAIALAQAQAKEAGRVASIARTQATAEYNAAVAQANNTAAVASNQAKITSAAANKQAGEVTNATKTQVAGIDSATNASVLRQESALKQGLAYNDPYVQAGTKALSTLQDKIATGPGEFTASPGYQFRLAEGQKAIDRQGSMGGSVLSGAQIKAQGRFAEDYATNDYDNFLSRYYQSLTPLEKLANAGQTAANSNATLAVNSGTNIGSTIYQGGVTSANALSTGLKDAAGITAKGTTDAASIDAAGKIAKTNILKEGTDDFWGTVTAGDLAASSNLTNAANIKAANIGEMYDLGAGLYKDLGQVETDRIRDIADYNAAGLTSSTNALAGGIRSAGDAQAAGTSAAGNALAAGQINSANAITGGVNSGVNNALLAYNLFKTPSTYTAGTSSNYGVDYGYDPNAFKSSLFSGGAN